MNFSGATLLCLAYIVALAATALLRVILPEASVQDFRNLGAALLALAVIAALVVPRIWRGTPQAKIWLMAGLVGALAVLHLQLRIPQPSAQDISQYVNEPTTKGIEQLVTVQGKIISQPQITPSQRLRFWLQAQQLTSVQVKEGTNYALHNVEGKLYVTVPLLQGTGAYLGQIVTVTGILYQPQAPRNPGSFDFKAYLAREGTFAALKGNQIVVENPEEQPWGWWRLRRRILRAQLRWLGSPQGQVLSSIVLGRRAVDLPNDVLGKFVKAGLAHVLAASGFHISLLLSVVLVASRSLPIRSKFIVGCTTLAIYLCLTGFQPSVLRAALMGLGALIALITQRQVKTLGALLLAATILLLVNPLWIEDLGFQLSFLATLGLVVTAPAIAKYLDFLPTTIANIVAVPIAATLWTLPLVIHVFQVIAPYSILTNILVTPLIIPISLGGMLSAGAALIFPLFGSAIAWLLYFPIQLLLAIIEFINQLPGSSWVVGSISLSQMLAIYGLIVLVWCTRRLQVWWWLVALFACTLVVTPIVYTRAQLSQVTVLATNKEPVIVIQDQGKVVLINSGQANTARFSVLPFLRQQGVNQIDLAIALESQNRLIAGWNEILANLPLPELWYSFGSIKQAINETESTRYQPLELNQTLQLGSLKLKLISRQPAALLMQMQGKTWLLCAYNQPTKQNQAQILKYLQETENVKPEVILWSTHSSNSDWLTTLNPQVIIAYGDNFNAEIASGLKQQTTQVYSTERDGAVQWSLQQGFNSALARQDVNW